MTPIGGTKHNPFNYHPEDDHTTDQAALRNRIAQALYAHNHPGWATHYIDLDDDEQDTYLARADAVLAVLPTPTDQAAEADRLQDKVIELEAELAKATDVLRSENQRANDAIDREDTAEQAVLEARQDRGAVLREAADVAARWNSDCQNCATELEVRDELRRLADEEQTAIDRSAVMPPVGGMKSNPFNYHPEDDPAADRAELRDRIAQAARTVPLRLGPNAISMSQRGEPIILSGTEADNLADAVLAACWPSTQGDTAP